jgi:rhodanese-related sulfurtransferase
MSMQSEPIDTISVQDLENRARQGSPINLIDVRTPAEFREVHAVYARNFPLDELNVEEIRSVRKGAENLPLYVICNSGGRSSKASEKLARGGLSGIVNVAGGTRAWVEAGLPVVRGEKAISLERQVRIAAGALVLTGAVLGYFIHPFWIGLSALIGAGLMFSGITDTCGMAMALARLPWNKVRDQSSESNCRIAP